jgi:N-carbamoyl-L-amino-acid hydrolase
MESQIRGFSKTIMEQMQLTFDEKCIWTSPAVAFDSELIQCVTRAAERAGYPSRQIVSGAGHDAAYIARVAPTAMIFVPCLNGLSHNEAESATFEDCAAGSQVLLDAILEFDYQLGSS